jgi:hypothetical protein
MDAPKATPQISENKHLYKTTPPIREARNMNVCPVCQQEVGYDDIIILESGEMSLGIKSNLPIFHGDKTRCVWHPSCFFAILDRLDWPVGTNGECVQCGESVGRWAFRLKMGYVDGNTGGYHYFPGEDNYAVLCSTCTRVVLDIEV